VHTHIRKHICKQMCTQAYTQAHTHTYNGYNGGWPSARLFGWSAADWSRPATNKSISSERKRKSLLFVCWERKSWTSWLLTCSSKKSWAAEKSSKKGVNRKEKCFLSSHTHTHIHTQAHTQSHLHTHRYKVTRFTGLSHQSKRATARLHM